MYSAHRIGSSSLGVGVVTCVFCTLGVPENSHSPLRTEKHRLNAGGGRVISRAPFENREGPSCLRTARAEDTRLMRTDGWTHMYAAHHRCVRAHCARLLRDVASAEDAVHEVFIRVGRYTGSWPAAGEIRPWLFRIATNYCLNELRSRGVRGRAPPQLLLPPGDPQESMAARHDALRLLERLPPRARSVALLTYVDGMLQHEVAEALGVSRRTVVSYLTRVRECAGETAPPRRAGGRARRLAVLPDAPAGSHSFGATVESVMSAALSTHCMDRGTS